MTNIIQYVREIALEAHKDQWYPPKEPPPTDNRLVQEGIRVDRSLPFQAHLGHVIGVLYRYGFDRTELICAAWLHDVIEDTHLTIPRLRELLKCSPIGDWITDIVGFLTDPPGDSRKERKRLLYLRFDKFRGNKIAQEALIVKLADRIANVESSYVAFPKFFEMYQKEHENFIYWLYPDSPREARPMWNRLDELLIHG